MLEEISRLGGAARRGGAEGALKLFEAALRDLVREKPEAYGAAQDAASQNAMAERLLESVRTSFLARTVENLRREAGYVRFCGCWIHRAAFTFLGFGLLAAATLPFCLVSLMSTSAWGWVPGTAGLLGAVLLGAWILSRIRSS